MKEEINKIFKSLKETYSAKEQKQMLETKRKIEIKQINEKFIINRNIRNDLTKKRRQDRNIIFTKKNKFYRYSTSSKLFRCRN